MSHAGPPEPPDPNQPDPGAPGSPETPGEQPWSPYPAGWDQPKPSGPADPQAYGQPAPPAYEQNPYQQNPYGQNPYGAAPAGPAAANPYAGPTRPDRPVFGFGGYASWFSRVGAYLIDSLVGAFAGFPLWIGYGILIANTSTTTTTNPDGTTSTTTLYDGSRALPLSLILIGALTGLAFYVWNICLRQGRTGATIGKSALAIRLVNSDQQPIGAGWSFLRNLLHVIDTLPCACLPLGYLWPIWDEHKQTFSDKIMSTYVIHATEVQPRPY